MSNLETLIKTISDKKALVATKGEVEQIEDPTAKRMKLGHIKRAKEDLEDLFAEYRTEMRNRVAFILAVGGQAEKFANVAEKSFGCFSADAETFYYDMVRNIPEKAYLNQVPHRGLIDHLTHQFEARAKAIGIVGYQGMLFESKYKGPKITDIKGIMEFAKKVFNDKVGSEVVGIDALDKISEKAANSGYSGKTVAIVLHTTDEELTKSFSKDFKNICKNVFIVSAGAKVNKEIQNMSLSTMRSVGEKSVEASLLSVKTNLT
ncbi:MAG: hypothetical protein ACTSU6_02090 [Candidatus Njordarchaeales archaeon]